MRYFRGLIAFCWMLSGSSLAASKAHVITFGSSSQVQWFVGADEQTQLTLKVRPLYIDGKLKEFTTGEPRDITDRAFVVRRAYRVNDQLPSDPKQSPKWKWQRGGWLLVDRPTARVSILRLPDFDPFYSTSTWYRDYVAYCGVSPDAEKVFAIVAQIGVKKPLVRQELGRAHGGELPDSECDPPSWQRQPVRVSIVPKDGLPVTFAVHRQTVEIAPENEEEQ